ncbi:unnamed protein product, partial [Iphiclides podalirius]
MLQRSESLSLHSIHGAHTRPRVPHKHTAAASAICRLSLSLRAYAARATSGAIHWALRRLTFASIGRPLSCGPYGYNVPEFPPGCRPMCLGIVGHVNV